MDAWVCHSTRDWLIRRGARPVMYVPIRSDDNDYSSPYGKAWLKDIQAIYRLFKRQFYDPIRDENRKGRTLGRDIDGHNEIIDAVHTALTFYFLAFVKPYNFELPVDDIDYAYSEREWRITNYLRFVPDDVAHVVVSAGYVDLLACDMPRYRDKIFVIS